MYFKCRLFFKYNWLPPKYFECQLLFSKMSLVIGVIEDIKMIDSDLTVS